MRSWMLLVASAFLLTPMGETFADEPLLRFGVVSDIHITAADDAKPEQRLVRKRFHRRHQQKRRCDQQHPGPHFASPVFT